MKVSIVIPTYKRANKLSQAIENVLEQTFQDFEVNVVSDGFHKETDLVMERYIENKKIKYYSYSKNKGGNFARNLGIEKSLGEYIAFLDDDDLWASNKLEKQVDILDSNPDIGLVYTGKKTVYPSLNKSYINLPKETGDLSKKIFNSNYIGSTSNVMIRKKILKETGLFDERLPSMQDRELWIRVCQITQIGAVKEPLFIYVNESNNKQISTDFNKKIKAFKILENKYAVFFENNPKLYKAFKKGVLESVLRISQRINDKETLKKYSYIYIKEYKDFSSLLFLLSTKIPFKYLLKLRSLQQ